MDWLWEAGRACPAHRQWLARVMHRFAAGRPSGLAFGQSHLVRERCGLTGTDPPRTVLSEGVPVRLRGVPPPGRLPARPVLSVVADAALDALAVVAPTECSGCGAPDRAHCTRCRTSLRPRPVRLQIGGGQSIRVVAGLRYTGTARRVLIAFKETGRTDAAAALAEVMRVVVSALLADCVNVALPGTVELATIPSTRAAFRVRGYHPSELVLARAGLRTSHPLRAARQTGDQSALSLTERALNRAGSLTARTDLARRRFLLIDDIVTTGSTLLEARRAIETAGGAVLGAAVLANTERRGGIH